MISTRDLSGLATGDALVRLCQSLATLDAILCPEWEFRYFSFNDEWGDGEKLALMRNGEGDDFLAFFNPEGAIIKGFAVGAPMATDAPRPGLFDDVPACFEEFLDEPAFSRDATTFCTWWLKGQSTWQVGDITLPPGPDPDGSGQLLRFLDGQPGTYKAWGDEYFGVPLDFASVDRIYRHVPLTRNLVARLNPETDFPGLAAEMDDIGYPLA
ncbi:MAG: hypothetical protein AAFX50_03205 [Acidobacteriota bacterium]